MDEALFRFVESRNLVIINTSWTICERTMSVTKSAPLDRPSRGKLRALEARRARTVPGRECTVSIRQGAALSANMTETPASFGITVGRWR